ncbi:GAF domain-containing protein [Robbsia sp. Bb-Pol-6]|uniref:histidine kinase n=1 Tax=Robbsia betulipollinis TaxID=2981849 RepID=A0ABT3ZQ89_9BURK|nr:ATP-binding protein [Robbsia betulipollinis]MCY0388053.1 GAF domain-containing protein [Robbsia betulipollinis]
MKSLTGQADTVAAHTPRASIASIAYNTLPVPALDACDQEPIRVPGAIQPHGYLVALDADLRVVQTSANVGELTGEAAEALLGRHVETLIGAAGARVVAEVLETVAVEDKPLYIGRVAWTRGNGTRLAADADGDMTFGEGAQAAQRPRGERMLDMLLHSHAGVLLLEIEPTAHVGNVFSPIYALVRTFVQRLEDADTLQQLLDLAAREVRRITGYGRVLVYRFDEDGHGQVLAEDRDPEYASYLDHFFPAADIPKQARELYLLNHIRLIADAAYVPAPLIPAHHPETGAPTDLSYAALRSVSPVHLEYMRNMGTASSMSISIVVRGKLWGLISCHHASARQVGFEARAACEHLCEVLSLQVAAKEESAEAGYRLGLRKMLVELISAMSDRDDFTTSIVSSPVALLRFMSAHGAAVVYAGRIVTVGVTPDTAVIQRIVDYIATSSSRDVFHTDTMSELLSWEEGDDVPDWAASASGVLAVQISKIHRHFVLWFRPEVVRTIAWAGDPRKVVVAADTDAAADTAANACTPASAGNLRVSPRESFETWRQTVRHRSRRWHDSEINIALDFRTSILGIVLRRAEEMAQLAAELGRVNKELEAFSYSVSHDLRAPLRHIVGYGDLLREQEIDRLSERGARFLQNIVDSAKLAGTLVDDLLSFSQMGRAALRPAPVSVRAMVDAVIRELEAENPGRAITWQIGPLPTVTGDAAFLILAVRNLLSNAVKYSKTRAQATIAIEARETAREHIVSIRDNGVGFNMRYVGKLFGVFQRLHRADEFEGTGIGLANVRRIIERHDGRTWAEGEPDKGATFFFSMPKVPAVSAPSARPLA